MKETQLLIKKKKREKKMTGRGKKCDAYSRKIGYNTT